MNYMTADEKIYLNGESGAGEILTEKGTLYQADKSAKTIIWAEGSDGDTSLFMKNTDSEDPIKQVDGIQSLLYSSSDYMTLVAQKQNGITEMMMYRKSIRQKTVPVIMLKVRISGAVKSTYTAMKSLWKVI